MHGIKPGTAGNRGVGKRCDQRPAAQLSSPDNGPSRLLGRNCCNQAIALVDMVAETAREANSIPPSDYGIAGVSASWHNNGALADLRHGTVFRPVKKRPTCVFWQAYLCPRATGG